MCTMSSSLNLKLVNPLIGLHMTETKEIPAYHPFKYCLRVKSVKTQTKNSKGLDESGTTNCRQTKENINGLAYVLSKVQVQDAENCVNQQDTKKTSVDLKVQTINDNFIVSKNVAVNTLDKSLHQNREYLRHNHRSPNFSKSSPTGLPTQLKKSTPSCPRTCDKKQYCKPPVWKSSTLKSFISSGVGKKIQQTPQFAYDLSRDELKCMGSLKGAMKPATEQELKLLKTGQRLQYLTQRYTQAPECKYNYPEATSWRIGWIRNQRN